MSNLGMGEWALSHDEAIQWMERRTVQELRDWGKACESIVNPVHLCEYPQAAEIKEKYQRRIAAIDAELANKEQGVQS